MSWSLPDREAAKAKGWTHQVQWMEDGKPCHARCTSGKSADAWARRLKKDGLKPIVIDLVEALRVH